VLYAFQHGSSGDIFVRKAPAATIAILTRALCELLDRPNHEVREIGTRHGEKAHETLLSREERAAATDLGDYFRVPPDARDLNYAKFFEQGEKRITASGDYTSHNTRQLDVPGMKEMLLRLPLIQAAMRGELVAAEY